MIQNRFKKGYSRVTSSAKIESSCFGTNGTIFKVHQITIATNVYRKKHKYVHELYLKKISEQKFVLIFHIQNIIQFCKTSLSVINSII